MKLNIKSLFRAVMQIGGVLVAEGVVTGGAADTITHITGIGLTIAGVLWGQANAVTQATLTKFANAIQ